MNRNLLTIDDLCHELGIGRSTAYRLLKRKNKELQDRFATHCKT